MKKVTHVPKNLLAHNVLNYHSLCNISIVSTYIYMLVHYCVHIHTNYTPMQCTKTCTNHIIVYTYM